jgi:hypothetical protein
MLLICEDERIKDLQLLLVARGAAPADMRQHPPLEGEGVATAVGDGARVVASLHQYLGRGDDRAQPPGGQTLVAGRAS